MLKAQIFVDSTSSDAIERSIKQLKNWFNKSGMSKELKFREKGFLTRTQKRKVKDKQALKRLKQREKKALKSYG